MKYKVPWFDGINFALWKLKLQAILTKNACEIALQGKEKRPRGMSKKLAGETQVGEAIVASVKVESSTAWHSRLGHERARIAAHNPMPSTSRKVKCISKLIYEEIHNILKIFIKNVICEALSTWSKSGARYHRPGHCLRTQAIGPHPPWLRQMRMAMR
ncbi:hypothetical protein ACMD2_22177 [Ananas comosus]|uniref:Uncharacterized protein n=1 Tax=Ananas comosus TaxID=4615 RepID=A0A199W764_ANACO|nr:hypothetical protein ACMD2_22177 [Ananas comosus]